MIVEHQPSSVKQALAGQLLKQVLIKGLIVARMPLAHCIEHMGELVRSQDRLRRLQQQATRP
ncbi:hypothetical protein KTH_56140 [Thermosporothrix hazakensis]|nr:hypothetical protein KTH_56140 [Thermosporothrix hazakensis]